MHYYINWALCNLPTFILPGLGFEYRWVKRNVCAYLPSLSYKCNDAVSFCVYILLIMTSSVQFIGSYFLAAGLYSLALLSVYKCKKSSQFKTVFNGDTAYITQLKQQKSKRCYYFCSTSP